MTGRLVASDSELKNLNQTSVNDSALNPDPRKVPIGLNNLPLKWVSFEIGQASP